MPKKQAPIARLDYWASEVRNGKKLLEELEGWHIAHDRRIMAFIHGHTHADYIYEERAFPIISIGCSKCEYFTDKKPEGAAAYRRVRHTVTQELWDTLIVDTEENMLRFVRFGAGPDREIQDGKLMRVQDNLMEEKKSTKVWAHRGRGIRLCAGEYVRGIQDGHRNGGGWRRARCAIYQGQAIGCYP